MANSTAGALKALIETLGLGITAYRDRAPQAQALPYVTIAEDISLIPHRLEDGAVSTGDELVQVDVWQRWRDPATNAITESATLVGAIVAGVHGASLGSIGAANKRAYVALVRNTRRMTELDNNLVHHAIDVDVKKQL